VKSGEWTFFESLTARVNFQNHYFKLKKLWLLLLIVFNEKSYSILDKGDLISIIIYCGAV